MVNLTNITRIKDETIYAIREYGTNVKDLTDIKRGIAIERPNTTKTICEYETLTEAKEALSYFSPTVLVDARIDSERPICFAEFAIVGKDGSIVEQANDTKFFTFLQQQIEDIHLTDASKAYLEKSLDRYVVKAYDICTNTLCDLKGGRLKGNVISNTFIASFDTLKDATDYLSEVHPVVNIDIDSNPKAPITYTAFVVIDTANNRKVISEKGPEDCFKYVNSYRQC